MAGPFVFESFNFLISKEASGGYGERLTVLPGNFYQHWPGTDSPVFGSRIRRRAGNWNRCSLR
jgi:hypothetical protein